jgi:hypothetical protein
MYCSTCGALITPGRSACGDCGTRVARVPTREALHPVAHTTGYSAWKQTSGHQCPRCGYQGEGLSYFSRGGNVAKLVGATVLTAGAMGAGGILYYVVRREHQICPRCGHGWGRFGEQSVAAVAGGEGSNGLVLPSAGAEKRKMRISIGLFVFAAFMAIVGLSEGEAVPFMMALFAAGGGAMLQHSARTDREARRDAILASLQLPVLQLAARHGGRLTVTRVAAEMGWTMPRAEKVLNAMDDGIRVNSEVTDEGVIVYEFRELLGAPEPPKELPGDSA